MTKEEIALYREAVPLASEFSRARVENKLPREPNVPPPYSKEALVPLQQGSREYQRWIKLIRALKTKDPKKIAKARKNAHKDWWVRRYTEDELRAVLSPEEVQLYLEAQPKASKWSVLAEEARQRGEPLHEQNLNDYEKDLRDAKYVYNRLQEQMRAVRKGGAPKERIWDTRTYTQPQLKAWLDLESVADYVTARRLEADYRSEYNEAKKVSDKPAHALRTRLPKAKHDELLAGKRLYARLQRLIHKSQDAAGPGDPQLPSIEQELALRPPDRTSLFTPKQATRAKQALNLKEIEAYVNGKRAEAELARCKARNKEAKRSRRESVYSQDHLDHLQGKVDRYRELHRTINQRIKGGISSQPSSGVRDPGWDDDAENNPPPLQPSPGGHQAGTEKTPNLATEEQQQEQSSAEQPQKRKKQQSTDKGGESPAFMKQKDPLEVANKVKERFTHLGDQWQQQKGSLPRLPAPNEILPFLGNSARNAAMRARNPAVI
ncbi:MAG: hypothetical protein M1823_004495 [Watsoniomyces obsoletus]|nr:MAG: hypothetical protein M1823_004495 [Watsoniomyces obsoletus]